VTTPTKKGFKCGISVKTNHNSEACEILNSQEKLYTGQLAELMLSGRVSPDTFLNLDSTVVCLVVSFARDEAWW
jgi:hypothetical protein